VVIRLVTLICLRDYQVGGLDGILINVVQLLVT